MKILILIDAWFPFIGGAQIQIKNLKNILEKKYKCQYYILHSPSANIVIRFLWSFWVIFQVILLDKKQKFDLIHAHAYWPGIPGKILSIILKIPVVFTVHGSNLLDLRKKSIRAILEKAILTKIKYNWVITVSSNFLKYRNINKNITVIVNGVNVKKFNKIKVSKAKVFRVLFVGRDDPVKGLSYLKKAINLIKKTYPKIELVVIQKNWKYSSLIQEYKKSHVFVLPSLSEGQPLTLLEAWAAKLPVVVTKVGENPRMVKNGYNGYLVKPGNVDDLAEKIIKVLKNKDRKIFGKRGYNLVKNKYSWEICAQKTYEIYKKVVPES